MFMNIGVYLYNILGNKLVWFYLGFLRFSENIQLQKNEEKNFKLSCKIKQKLKTGVNGIFFFSL